MAMASNISAINTMNTANTAAVMREASTPDVRRSRFSFHFSTLRTRRWLLVQLVSVDDSTPQSSEAVFRRYTQTRLARPSYEHLIDDFHNGQLFRWWA